MSEESAAKLPFGLRLLKLALVIIAIGLLASGLALVVVGVKTDWMGLRPTRYSVPVQGARTTCVRIMQGVNSDMRYGATLEEAVAEINWDYVLTHWHVREDVSVELTSSTGAEADGGRILFRATDNAPSFAYDVKSRRIQQVDR